jgi:hypothetical protein
MSEQGSPSPAADAPAPAPSDPSPTPPAPSPAERAKEPTPRASIDRAFAKAGVDEAPSRAPEPIGSLTEPVEAKPAPEPEAKPERQRGPDGKFLAAEGAKAAKAVEVSVTTETKDVAKAEKPNGHFAEPPTRFSPDAKTAWKDAPEPVRAEVHRAFREMEQGIQKYRDDATAFADLKDYDALAKQHGTTIRATMDQYIRLSQVLQSRDPMPAIQELLRHAGLTVQDLVAHVSGQQPEQASAGAAREIMELRNQVGQLQQQLQGELGQVKSTLQQQQQQGLLGEIQQFAADKPRFDELSMEIAAQVRAGYDLDEAYVRAERLNPLPAAPVPPAAAQNGAPDPAVQPRGSLSVTGAPAAGSDPRNRGPSPTTRAALDKSFAFLGLPQ